VVFFTVGNSSVCSIAVAMRSHLLTGVRRRRLSWSIALYKSYVADGADVEARE
jgi:hypothetical protein